MADDSPQAYWVIVVSFFVAFVLAVLPFPSWLQWARPEWLSLTLIYWCIALPHRVGILTALILGVAVDVLEGAVMGQNAFALVVIASLAWILYQRLRVFSLLQQSGVVFVLIGIQQLICQWVQNLEGAGAQSAVFLLPAVTSALIWPIILHLLRGLRRYYDVR
jgi:rod shape-determining protein MreD